MFFVRRSLTLLAMTGVLLLPAPAAADPIAGIDPGVAGFVGMATSGPLDTPTLVTSWSGFQAQFGGYSSTLTNPNLAPAAAAFFANGGNRLWVVRVASAGDAALVGTDGGSGQRTGLASLLDVDEVAAVAIPGATTLAVQGAMITHTESRGDRIALLDPPAGADPAAVLAHRANLASADGFAALYYPWLVASPTGESLTLPPSGFVAGLYASHAPPDSPVGPVATASGVSRALSTAESDQLNSNHVNPIRFFAGNGVQVWGARTLSSDPEWKYVPVRRTALYLEESIHEGTQWAVFEPNDETLWSQLRACVGDFLQARYQAGWFQGTTPQNAYFVKCDASTMTQDDLEQGRTVLLVGFAPLRPAEFVVLSIVQERGGATAVRPASVLRLGPAVPNPFNPRTTLSFDLPRGGVVSLVVFDARGRAVRTLVDGRRDSGRQEVVWDGRDRFGQSVASGVYRVRLRAEGTVESRPLTLIR